MHTASPNASAAAGNRHYWLREDFDHLMGLLPGTDAAQPDSSRSPISLVYPKLTQGAAAELKLRGFKCDVALLERLAEEGVVNPTRGQSVVSDNQGNVGTVPSERVMYWSKEGIDAAAEHLYEDDANWNSWLHFCWVGNLRYGQVAKAYRVATARYDLGFSPGWDVPGLVTVIEPPEEGEQYAYLRFLARGTKVAPEDDE